MCNKIRPVVNERGKANFVFIYRKMIEVLNKFIAQEPLRKHVYFFSLARVNIVRKSQEDLKYLDYKENMLYQ